MEVKGTIWLIQVNSKVKDSFLIPNVSSHYVALVVNRDDPQPGDKITDPCFPAFIRPVVSDEDRKNGINEFSPSAIKNTIEFSYGKAVGRKVIVLPSQFSSEVKDKIIRGELRHDDEVVVTFETDKVIIERKVCSPNEFYQFNKKQLQRLVSQVAFDVKRKGFGPHSVANAYAGMWLSEKLHFYKLQTSEMPPIVKDEPKDNKE